MTSRTFVVRVADLENGPQRLTCPLSAAWLAHTLADTDARPRGHAAAGGAAAPEHPEALPDGGRACGKLDVELALNGRDVVVRGKIEAALEMPCSITLDPVPVDVASEVFLLLSPKGASRGGRRSASAAGAPPGSRSRGPGRAGAASATGERVPDAPRRDKHHRADADSATTGWSEDALLDDEDAARDTYQGDDVVLDEFLREFIVLELPMNPRRSDLRSDEDVAIALRSAGLATANEPSVDPRLAPLAAIASRLRQKKE